MALTRPARKVPEVRVHAVAARDIDRARAFAQKHGIARVHDSYEALLADPEIDAVYNPLPNGLHTHWNLRALEAGKHILCEKPLASNAAEAEAVERAAASTDRVVMEAFHYRYHPLANRMREVVDSGALGKVRQIEINLCIPFLKRDDIRFRYDLAGGATMDLGCYAIHMLRHLAGDEPTVLQAHALLAAPNVDRAMSADFQFSDGRTGRIACSLMSSKLFRMSARVKGELGEMRVLNPLAPQFYHRLTLRTPDGKRVERLSRTASYIYQLRAFAAAVRDGAPNLTPPADSVANMRVIDAVYEAAGLSLRGV